MMVPRYYQEDAVNAVFSYFGSKQGNPLIAMPTGTGKSVVIASFCARALTMYPGTRIFIATHVKELVGQNYLKLLAVWPNAPAGVHSSGLGRDDTDNPIIFGGIASVYKKSAAFGHRDLLIVDEAHLVGPNETAMYQQFIAGLKETNPYLKIIGLTATPYRLGTGLLYGDDRLFTDMAIDLTTPEWFGRFVAEGYMAPLVPKPTKLELSTEGLHKRGGEFVEKEMQAAFDKEEITYGACLEMLEAAADRHCWLIYTTGVHHTESACEILNSLGVSALAVHSKMNDKQRDANIRAHKEGRVKALVNNNILTTGYDFPPVDMIGVLRATDSAGLWVQIMGRGTRPYDWWKQEQYVPGFNYTKANCLVLDFARNTRRLGRIDAPHIPKKKGAGGGDAPVKECQMCGVYNHASVRHCGGQPFATAEGCGAEFQFKVKFQATAASDALMGQEEPVVVVYEVERVTFDMHYKEGKPPSIKVSYFCKGLKKFTDYICPEHEPFIRRRSERWWRERTNGAVLPLTTEQAYEQTAFLLPPTHLRVWVNKQYPQILKYCFDGTAFGEKEPGEVLPAPEKTLAGGYYDGDIPF